MAPRDRCQVADNTQGDARYSGTMRSLSFVEVWMELEGIMGSEMNQEQKDNHHVTPHS